MDKKIPYIEIVTCILYFIVVMLFLITKSGTVLTIWESLTIIGAPVILFVLIELANIMDISHLPIEMQCLYLCHVHVH